MCADALGGAVQLLGEEAEVFTGSVYWNLPEEEGVGKDFQ